MYRNRTVSHVDHFKSIGNQLIEYTAYFSLSILDLKYHHTYNLFRMFSNYFKSAWRSIWKNKNTTAINITGLSVGMTAAILIFLWIQNEMNYDNYHKDAADIYRLTTNLKANGWIWETTPLLLADAAKKEVPEIEKTTRLYAGEMLSA